MTNGTEDTLTSEEREVHEVHDTDFFHGVAESAVNWLPNCILDACRPVLWRWLAARMEHTPYEADSEGYLSGKEVTKDQLRREIIKDLQRMDPGLLVGANANDSSASIMEKRLHAVERLLFAYGEQCPNIGYCQGLNFVAVVLLQILDERFALKVLSALVAKLPKDLFSSEPEMFAQCRTSVQVRFHVVLIHDRPRLSSHLFKLGLDFNLFLPRWHTTMFSGIIARPATLRLWDHILGADGGDAVLRLALAIFTRAEVRILQCENILDVLRELTEVAGRVQTAADVDRMLHHEWPLERLTRAERAPVTTDEIGTKLKTAPMAPKIAGGFVYTGDWKLMLAGCGPLVLVKLQDIPSVFLHEALLLIALAVVLVAMAANPICHRPLCEGPVLGRSGSVRMLPAKSY